ncbi:hypothetical protein C3B44_03405 [Corynebacterium yudongzhengii]|uniref:Uncharacterized protein n=1 Tax=Corynebacterium yudongzhengii TaxID=2080740 RepID=A0A2U1T7D1_9CORY|nr:hypothetical protein [Corynebacterium yudongzhengii]AWB81518.1 hypothetical protein C3B44_03405 [Corynebacterium yudongzhengii]PWC01911.1 hypothetical protein DF222_04840 [Corynebacterium yudongzhengii]
MSHDEYVAALVEREIAYANEVVAAQLHPEPEADPMSAHLPLIVAVVLIVSVSTTLASLGAVVFF